MVSAKASQEAILGSLLILMVGLSLVPVGTTASSSPVSYSLATPLSDVMPTPNLEKTITTNSTDEFALGPVSVLVILVEFSNLNHTVSREEIHSLYFDKLSGYYKESSYGQVWVTGTTAGWYRLGHTLSYYGKDGQMVDDPNGDGGIDSWWLIRDAIVAADPDVDFAQYNHVVVVHAGNGQESSGASNDIWSVAYWGGLWLRTQDAKSVYGGNIVPESEAQGASPFGVYTHELSHLLGLVDCYGQGGKKNWLGRWGLMDRGLWNGDPPGSSPAQPTSWDRIKLGWIPSSKVAQVNASMKMNITLSALEVEAEGASYQIVKIPVTSTFYYLVEVRMRIGYDSELPDEGVLMYAVDSTLTSSNGMVRVLDGNDETETLNDAVYQVGQSFADAKNRLSVTVLSKSSPSYAVAVDRSGPAPDIAVEKVYFTPTTASVNETVTLKADIANRGTQTATGYPIDCRIDDELYRSFTVTLASGASTTLSVDWTAQSGLHRITFSLNRAGAIVDSNPANDALTAELVVGYSIIIQLPTNMTVKVNGTDRYPDDQGRIEIGTLGGDLIVELPPTVQLSGDTRLAFSQWSDGTQTNTRTIHATEDHTLTALYARQYLLSLDPNGGQVAGSGWYNEGSEATAQAASPSNLVEGKTRLTFTQWTGDTNSSSGTFTLTMDKPHRLQAQWQTQYYLTINSPFGPVDGSGWYDEQTTVNFILETTQDERTGVKASFKGWNGDFTGASSQGAVTMNGPKSVEALWTFEYYVQVTSDYGSPSGSGWYLEGSEARIRVDPVVEPTPGTRHVFTGWADDITSPNADVTVKVDKPLNAQATWKTQHFVKFTTLGLPQGTAMNLTLNGVEKALTAPFTEGVWYDAGTVVNFNASQRIPVRMGYYLFDHWEDAAGHRASNQYAVDKPATFSAVYKQGLGCIIATATYGSALSPEVSLLRAFRDHQILSSFAGFSFMTVFNRWYYSFSPHVADQITIHDWVKPALRVILAPLLAILRVSAEAHSILAGNQEVAAVGAGLIASALIGAVYGSPLAAVAKLTLGRRVRRFKLSTWRVASVLLSLVAASLGLIMVAEVVHSYPLMEFATASLILTTIAFTAHSAMHLVPKTVSIGFNLVKQRL